MAYYQAGNIKRHHMSEKHVAPLIWSSATFILQHSHNTLAHSNSHALTPLNSHTFKLSNFQTFKISNSHTQTLTHLHSRTNTPLGKLAFEAQEQLPQN